MKADIKYHPKERFLCWVEAKDTSFKEKISIIIRPDSTGNHLAMTVAVQIGTDVLVDNENLDDGKSVKKTFKHERQAVMRDIKRFILEELKKRDYAIAA